MISISSFAALNPVKGTMEFEITREYYDLYPSTIYKPYAAWWIEDNQGNLVKTLYVTLYPFELEAVPLACGITAGATYIQSLTLYYDRHGCPPDSDAVATLSAGECPIDGISGCSESRDSTGDSLTVIKKVWDMTDNDGNTVSSGTYHFFYDASVFDETLDPADKAWKVTFTIAGVAWDSSQVSPDSFYIGSTLESYIPSYPQYNIPVLAKINFAFGGFDTAIEDDGITTSTKIKATVDNSSRGFCGSQGPSAAFILLIGFATTKSIRRRKKKQ